MDHRQAARRAPLLIARDGRFADFVERHVARAASGA
jgi:hypothetical protein